MGKGLRLQPAQQACFSTKNVLMLDIAQTGSLPPGPRNPLFLRECQHITFIWAYLQLNTLHILYGYNQKRLTNNNIHFKTEHVLLLLLLLLLSVTFVVNPLGVRNWVDFRALLLFQL